jgi:hypothetical protein
VIRHLRDSHADRELLAMKVRVLVARAYKRAESRQRLRDAGLEIPESEPNSWEAFEDRIFKTFKPSVQHEEVGLGAARVADNAGKAQPAPRLKLLDGGVEDPLAGVAAAGRSDTGQALRHGGKPPLRSGESVAAHPPNFETEETE